VAIWKCPYCWAEIEEAGESAHVKAHVIALLRTGDYRIREVAALLSISPNRAAAYFYNAGLRLKLCRTTHTLAAGQTPEEIEEQGRLLARHGFVPTSPIQPAPGGGRYLYQIWERQADKKTDDSAPRPL